MTPVTARLHSDADRLLEEAAELDRKAEESFERCDTDGFLSQWSSRLTAELKRAQAAIADRGGLADFPALCDGDRVIRAKMINGRYGTVWLLDDDEAADYGRTFVPFGENSRVQAALGLHQDTVPMPAYAKITGSGNGLSGATSCRVVVLPDYRELGWDF